MKTQKQQEKELEKLMQEIEYEAWINKMLEDPTNEIFKEQ